MSQTATSDRQAGHESQQDEQWRRLGARGWIRVAKPWLAWWLCGTSLVLLAAGLVLLVLSRHAWLPPSIDGWDEQALVALEFLGAPILGGLIAARRPANLTDGCGASSGWERGSTPSRVAMAFTGWWAGPASCRAPRRSPGPPTSPGSLALG